MQNLMKASNLDLASNSVYLLLARVRIEAHTTPRAIRNLRLLDRIHESLTQASHNPSKRQIIAQHSKSVFLPTPQSLRQTKHN